MRHISDLGGGPEVIFNKVCLFLNEKTVVFAFDQGVMRLAVDLFYLGELVQ